MSETVVMDLTHTYSADDFPPEEILAWIDCTEITGTNCYCDEEAQRQLCGLMTPYSAMGIHFIDSGNYHYLSKLWMDKVQEPFSLVLFDHHPDMQSPRFEGVLSCGGWVRSLLEEHPFLQQVWLVGIDDALIGETEGFADRLNVISEEEALSFSSRGNNFFLTGKTDFLYEGGKIYISIDKDVLAPSEVHTNWNQGSLSMFQLRRQLEWIFSEAEVIGVDVCGEDPELGVASQIAQNKALNRELCGFLAAFI